MKKPSERIKELNQNIIKLYESVKPKDAQNLPREAFSEIQASAIIEFLDEWFGKTEFRNVGHFQVLTQKTKPIKIDGVETVKGDSAEGFICENCGHMTVVKTISGRIYQASSEK